MFNCVLKKGAIETITPKALHSHNSNTTLDEIR